MRPFGPELAVLIAALLLGGCSAILPPSEDYGKRSFGTVWDDQMTESRSKGMIREAHPDLKEAHVSVISFNGVVLLTGQVPSEEAKEAAGNVVSQLRHVTKVHNELSIAGPTSMIDRSNDSWLTTKVKTALLMDDSADGNRIKVVTEDGVVYLLGLLTRDEADNAVEAARDVFGVKKIVKVFEYIN